MPLWSVLAAVAALVAAITVTTTNLESAASDSGQARAIAGNMCVVRSALADYKSSHPGATGSVSMGDLTTLPTWFRPIDGVEVVIDNAGRGMVFYRRVAATLANELRTCGALVKGDAPVGYVKGAKLIEASSGNVLVDPITIVPEGAVAIVWR